jgi:hypothetical protein
VSSWRALEDTQYQPQIASDGMRGAFSAWRDGRSDADIYAQHLGNAFNAVAITSFTAKLRRGTVVLTATLRSGFSFTK